MLTQQIDRILLIEQFMNAAWNIGKAGWGSGTAKSCKIIGKILEAIINKEGLSVGLNHNNHIPPKEAAQFPYLLVKQLRDAGITWDDLEKVNARRDVNAKTLVYIIDKMFENGFKSIDSTELFILSIIAGKAKAFLSEEDIQKAKDANFIKLDYSGFFTKSRNAMFMTFYTETNLTPRQILKLSLPLSEQAMDKLTDKLLYHKNLIETDFLRLKDSNVTASEGIDDLINIAQGFGSRFSHIRSSDLVLHFGIDSTLLEYLSEKMTATLSQKYKYEPPKPVVPAVVEEPKQPTPEEIANEKAVRDNAYNTLLMHFHLEPEDAKKLVNTTKTSYLQSLWHIKTAVMPKIEIVLGRLMEKLKGNIQMVEDLVLFEQIIWSNGTEAFTKYKIPAKRASSVFKSMTTTVITMEESDILLTLNKELTLALIKPLRHNLTMKYKANHSDEEIIVGRDLEKFKEYALIHSWKVIPEFMYDNSNVIAVINSTHLTVPNIIKNTDSDFISADISSVEQRKVTNADLLLAGDLLIIGLLLLYMANHFRKPLNYWRKTFFGCQSLESSTANEELTEQAPEFIAIKVVKMS